MVNACEIASPELRYLEGFFTGQPDVYPPAVSDIFMADPLGLPPEKERKIDQALAQLEEGIQGILESDNYREYLRTLGKFHNYSLGNLILIWFQKKDATRVAGFNTWKDLGRMVKKGEKGIMILAPCFPPKGKKEPKPEPKPEPEGEDEEEEKNPIIERPVYFRVVYVFDISQTEGKELPSLEVPIVQGEDSSPLYEIGLQYCQKNGIKVLDKPKAQVSPDTMGYFAPQTREIWVRQNVPKNQQTKSLFHEIGHSRAADKFGPGAEVLAESIAYAVCNHFGYDTGVRSFPYVAGWAKDIKVLKERLDQIRSVTKDIIEELSILAELRDPGRLEDFGSIGLSVVSGFGFGIGMKALDWILKNRKSAGLEECHNEGLACKYCGRPVPPRAVAEVWARNHIKNEHGMKPFTDNGKHFPWVAGLTAVGEDYPGRKRALAKLQPYTIIEVHDDGDLTVFHGGNEWIVSTDGKAYINYKLADSGTLERMLLLTKENRKSLPPLRATENEDDPIVQVKFFAPWTYWTWYATEFDGEDEFYGLVRGHEIELGYFSLKELESVRGPYGLMIERDRHFKPTPLSKVREKLEAGIIADPEDSVINDAALGAQTSKREFIVTILQQEAKLGKVKTDLDSLTSRALWLGKMKLEKLNAVDIELRKLSYELDSAILKASYRGLGQAPPAWLSDVTLLMEKPKLVEVFLNTIVKHYRPKSDFHSKSFRVLKPNKDTLIYLACPITAQWEKGSCSENQELVKTIVKKTAQALKELRKLEKKGVEIKMVNREGVEPQANDDILGEIAQAMNKAQPVEEGG